MQPWHYANLRYLNLHVPLCDPETRLNILKPVNTRECYGPASRSTGLQPRPATRYGQSRMLSKYSAAMTSKHSTDRRQAADALWMPPITQMSVPDNIVVYFTVFTLATCRKLGAFIVVTTLHLFLHRPTWSLQPSSCFPVVVLFWSSFRHFTYLETKVNVAQCVAATHWGTNPDSNNAAEAASRRFCGECYCIMPLRTL